MTSTIAESVTPPEFLNKEELETNFAPMAEEDGIKEELVARWDPEEFIAQTKPRLRENDEESYVEATMTSHFLSERKQETAMAPTIEESGYTPWISK